MDLGLVLGEEDHLHGAFREDGGGGAERLAPHRIVEFWTRRGDSFHAGLHDRPGAVGAGEVGRHQRGPVGREAAPRRLEDRRALGVLEPDEAIVADGALREGADARWEAVAGGDLDAAIGGDQHRADLADLIGACGRRADRQVEKGVVEVEVSHRLVSQAIG